PSQAIGNRRAQTAAALLALTESLRREPDLDVRVVHAGTPLAGGDDGTRLFTAMNRAVADIPRQRLAGVVMITDGQVHDVPTAPPAAGAREIGAPLQVLLSGSPHEADRRLVVTAAPSFGLVGKDVPLKLRVEDLPTPPEGGSGGAAPRAQVTWRKDG